MWFRNLLIYRLQKALLATEIESCLKNYSFVPCGSQDLKKVGFVPAFGENFVHTANNMHLICVVYEEKIVPSSVINTELDAKIAKIEEQDARKVSKKEKTSLKDEILLDLLPRAFSKKSKCFALILDNFIIVDASSFSKAEEFNALLRSALGSLPVIPLKFKAPINKTLTSWIKDDAPNPFLILLEAELKDETSDASVLFKKQDLDANDVQAHLESGFEVQKLALRYKDVFDFVIHADGALKRVKFAPEYVAANDTAEDLNAKLDADFALMSSEIANFIPSLLAALGEFDDL